MVWASTPAWSASTCRASPGFSIPIIVGKGEYGVRSLEKNDLVFIHVEATDEAGHMGDVEKKIQALEDFDEKVVGTVLKGMAQRARIIAFF